MKRPVCVTSSNPVGCTFLEWSLQYLSGQHQYFFVENQKWQALSHNPINHGLVANAHGHQKNHPCGSEITKIFAHVLNEQQQQCPDRLLSFYPYPMHIDNAMRKLDVLPHELNNSDTQHSIRDCIKQDFVDLVEHCLNQNIAVVYVQSDPAVTGYFWHYRTLDRMLLSDHQPASLQEKHNEHQNAFFSYSQQQWQQLGLTDVWDQRERMALDIRPFDNSYIWDVGFDQPYQHINCQNLWDQTPVVVQHIMQELDIQIDTERFGSWISIMLQWQKIQLQNLKFHRELNHIVASIVNGWHYDMGSLELWQEAIIQHCLIYKHKLNLKTWQLNKFPTNTKQLHLLLEDNIHNVSDIY